MGIDFFTVQELAVKLELSTRTVLRMIERGEFKEGVDFCRLGRSVRFYKKVMVERFRLSEE